MKLKGFDGYSWMVALIYGGSVILVAGVSGLVLSCVVQGYAVKLGFFVFDSVSLFLRFLSLVLLLSLTFFLRGLRSLGKVMIGLRVGSSLLCYMRVHGLWF